MRSLSLFYSNQCALLFCGVQEMDNLTCAGEKERGNACFKKGNYKEAVELYTNALKICATEDKDMIVALYKNRAACWLKLKRHEDAISDCKAAIQLAPSDVKALYRLAQALEGKKLYSEAMKHIKHLLSIDPKNREAIDFAQKLIVLVNQHTEKSQSTDYLVNEMFQALENDETPRKRKF